MLSAIVSIMTKNRIMVTSFAHLNASGVLHIYRLKFSKAKVGLGWMDKIGLEISERTSAMSTALRC